MSRWADAFAALSGCADTLDTIRHSDEGTPELSQSVNSVEAPLTADATDTGATPYPVESERAAIIQHAGDIPQEWAEGFARLDPNHPPGDVPLRRWQRFVDDVGLFLDSGF